MTATASSPRARADGASPHQAHSAILIARARTKKDPVAWLVSRQCGVISRRQAECLGMSADVLNRRVRIGGPWQRMFPGVYLTVTGTPTIDQMDTAALLYAGDYSMITGLAALRRLGIWAPAISATDVLIPDTRRRVSRNYVRMHRTTKLPTEWLAQGEIRMAMIPRALADTALDLASVRDVRAVVAAGIQQGRCSVQQLEDELRDRRLHNAKLLRSVLAEVAAGIRSSPEGDLMDLIKKSGLPDPVYNPRLYIGDRLLARPDAWWELAGVAAEVDSREWHLSPEAWERTMKRHDRMTAAGIRVLHFSPSQIKTEPGIVAAIIKDALRTGGPLPGIRTVPAEP